MFRLVGASADSPAYVPVTIPGDLLKQMLSIDLKHLNDVCDAFDGLSVLKEDRGRAMGVVSCWRHGARMKLASARVVGCL